MKANKILFVSTVLIVLTSDIKAQSIFTPSGGITGQATNLSSVSIGFNSNTPLTEWAPLEIMSNPGFLTNGGWGRSIVLYPLSQSQTSTITWEKGGCTGCDNSFFIGGPSIVPPGDYWMGLTTGLNAGTQDMISQFYGKPSGVGINIIPQGSARFNHNLLVTDFNTGVPARFAIRTFNPRQAGHVNEGNFLITGRANKEVPINNGSILFSDADPGTNPDYNGNWGIQYTRPGYADPTDPGGLNFWTTANNPSLFKNNRLYLSNNHGNIGINNFNPSNQLEITSDGNDPVPSGLRFTNLTSASAQLPGYGGVLTVDAFGDVILVKDQIGAMANFCLNPLFVPKVINAAGDLDCSQIYDDGNFVGITTITPIPNMKLNVNGNITMENFSNAYYINDRKILSFGSSAIGQYETVIAGHRDIFSSAILGRENTVVGYNAGYLTAAGNYNTFVGSKAGYATNSTGAEYNTFVGLQSGSTNTTGYYNSYLGAGSGNSNQTGNFNSAIGHSALGNCNSGSSNVGVGYFSGFNFYYGDRDTYLGTFATALDINGQPFTAINASAVGAYAQVCESNTMVFGSSSNTVHNSGNPDYVERWGFATCPQAGHTLEIGVPGALIPNGEGTYMDPMGVWYPGSDKNRKENFRELDGKEILEKINQLPVTEWNYKRQKDVKHIGPMAQDFWQLFQLGHDDISISTIDPSGVALAGVKQLIKEKDELYRQLESKSSEIQSLKDEITLLKDKFSEFESALSECCTHFENKSQSGEVSSDRATLEQNIPNPFNERTLIKYYVPQSASSASLKIYSLDGAELKSFNLLQKGTGEVEISGNTMAPGTYVYHLIVDGKQIDGKLMTLTK